MCNSCYTPYYWTGCGWNRNLQNCATAQNGTSTQNGTATQNGGTSTGCGCCQCCHCHRPNPTQCANTITVPVTGQLTVRVPSGFNLTNGTATTDTSGCGYSFGCGGVASAGFGTCRYRDFYNF